MPVKRHPPIRMDDTLFTCIACGQSHTPEFLTPVLHDGKRAWACEKCIDTLPRIVRTLAEMRESAHG